MNENQFAAGAIIFQPGDPGTRAFLIREGTVELLKREGTPPIAVLGPGEVFGEMSLIEERPHGLFARAATKVKAHGLTREEFEQMLTTDPATFRTYLKTLFERLRMLSARFEAAQVEHAPAAAKTVTVTIHPLTRRAAETLPPEGLVITKFPFRMGRAAEARENDRLDLNDLWLLDQEPFHVSRNHAAITLLGEMVIVEDRGSTRGTHVNQTHVGVRNAHTHASLEEGDNVVVLGGHASPYQFRVHVSHA